MLRSVRVWRTASATAPNKGMGVSFVRTLRHGIQRRPIVPATRRCTHSETSTATATTTTNKKTHNSSSSSSSRSILPLSVVEYPLVQTTLPWIGHVSYMALASGFLMMDMLELRVALVGGYTGLVAFHVLHKHPLTIPLGWSAIFVGVNAGAACLLASDRLAGPIDQDDERLYQEHFPMLSRGQFYQLMKLGTRKDISTGAALTIEGEPCDKVYFVRKGKAKLYLRDAFAGNCDEGSFVNDVAFQHSEMEGDMHSQQQQQQQQDGAYGTVVTTETCSVICWDQSALREHLKKRPEMDRNMKYCFTKHLVKHLLRQREAAHLKSVNHPTVEDENREQVRTTVVWRPNIAANKHGQQRMLQRSLSDNRIVNWNVGSEEDDDSDDAT